MNEPSENNSRRLQHFVLVLAGLLILLTGCGQSDSLAERKTDEGLPAEAIAVREAFQSASISKKGPVEDALALVKAGSQNPAAYWEAIPQLQKLATNPTITPEQKAALEGLIEKLRKDAVSRR